tara:strand:- start:148948 stop:149340 length:393 start_codon:yes stop_codon:yes gene_type:complete
MIKNQILLTSWVLCGLAIGGCRPSASPPVDSTKTGVVTIEVELGDQLHKLTMDSVAEGTTLETVLRSVDEPTFVIKGRGTTAFVEAIGGQSTEGTEGWTFSVDGEFANQGIGATKLSPPVTVSWTYGAMQ